MLRDRKITRMAASFARREPGSIGRIAALARVDRTTVSHWFSEDSERKYPPPLDALEALLDELGVDFIRPTFEDRGYEILLRSRPTASPIPLEAGIWDLLEHASRVGKEVQAATADQRVDEHEAVRVRSALTALRDVCEGMLARLPAVGA